MKGIELRDRFGGTIDRFRDEMDNMVQRLFGEVAPTNGAEVWAPRVDVTESGQEFLVKADLPGVETKDLDIAVEGGALVIKGERKEEREEKKEGYRRYERFAGSFYREIPLPEGVDADKITAHAAKGVVSIHLPKKPGMRPKKITVQESK